MSENVITIQQKFTFYKKLSQPNFYVCKAYCSLWHFMPVKLSFTGGFLPKQTKIFYLGEKADKR